MAENTFHATVESLFKGMDSFITTKTVVGDAVHIGDTIILPLVDVSFGVGAGIFTGKDKNNGGGGMGGKIMPSAVLVLDMVPDFVNKFTSKNEKEVDEGAKEMAKEEMESILEGSVKNK